MSMICPLRRYSIFFAQERVVNDKHRSRFSHYRTHFLNQKNRTKSKSAQGSSTRCVVIVELYVSNLSVGVTKQDRFDYDVLYQFDVNNTYRTGFFAKIDYS